MDSFSRIVRLGEGVASHRAGISDEGDGADMAGRRYERRALGAALRAGRGAPSLHRKSCPVVATPWPSCTMREKESTARKRSSPALAVLDLGTNNCRLLIARAAAGDSFRVVDSFSRIVRLGEGVAATGRLSDAALDRTVAALKICAEHIAKSGARHVRAIATQAARLAVNSDVLVARARAETGIELSVISAEQEADLAALGCAPLIGRKYRGALIFDIGGGSTEIIRLRRKGDDFEKLLSVSLSFGVVTLSESYGPAAQSRAGFETMRAAMRRAFRALPDDGRLFDPAPNIFWARPAR